MSWEQAGPPDFPRLGEPPPAVENPSVCHVVVCHLDPAATEAVYNTWKANDPRSLVLMAYGGTKENFSCLPTSIHGVYIDDPALRTVDHSRERQQYTGVFKAASRWLSEHGGSITHVHVVEFDVVPTAPDVGSKLVGALETESADVAGFGLIDLTGTIHPQNRHQLTDAEFLNYLRASSRREVRDRILTMLGCSSIWTRGCFEEIANINSVPPVYLEIGIPSLAHHRGYRVRPLPRHQQRKYISFEGDLSDQVERAKADGGWLVHPCKKHWEGQFASRPDKKPRLLLCGHTYGAAVNRAKATALGRWFDVMVCSPDFEGINVMGRDGSLQEREIPDSTYQYRRLRRWPRKQNFTRVLVKGLREQFAQWQPDVVLCEAEPWSLLRWQCFLLSLFRRKRPLFVEFTWENIARPGLKGALLRGIYRLAATTSDAVICGNKGAESLILAAGMDPTRILRTGQLGVSESEYPSATSAEKSAWRAAHHLSKETFIIGFCGRLVEEKGVLDLLESVERLRSDSLDCSLVFLGSGILGNELQAKTETRPWFRLHPAVSHEEVPAIINRFDLLVLPSKPQSDPAKGLWEEQFGHVLLEAMIAGVPCVGSQSGGIPEVIENPSAVFPPGNIDALTSLLRGLINCPDSVLQLAASQQRSTQEKWTHEALAERYARFLLNLIAKGP